MPTSDRLSSYTALARLGAVLGRLGQFLSSRHAAIRWGSVLAIGLACLALCYWAASALSTVGVRYLASGRRFSSEDLIKICRALDEHRITDYRLDDRRVAVSADDFDEASTLLAKIDVGRHSIEELRNQSSAMSLFWETTEDRVRREQLKHERILEEMIGRQPGVVWSLVSIHYSRGSPAMRNPSKPSAFVYLETEGDRQLPFGIVQNIATILRGYLPDLNLHDVRVADRRGHRYLDPSDPSLGDISRKRAREEELSEKILEKLDWIKGVRVLVQIATPEPGKNKTAASGSQGTNTGRRNMADHGLPLSNQKTAAPSSTGTTSSAAEIIVNHSAELDLGPAAAPEKPMPPPPAASDSVGEPNHESGHILVNVPRSFYYYALVHKTDHMEPSPEEFQTMAARTESGVKRIVGVVLPEQGAWKVDVDTIPDELPLVRPAVLPYPTESRRKALDWGIVGAVGAAISILAAVGSWVHVARRPARLSESTAKTSRYRGDLASEPGPSERVRELVRRNPEAAASVLARWTVQREGGAGS
jgi:flagellar M-ring protein FliF